MSEIGVAAVDDEILKPGLTIRPEISHEEVRKLSERLYGIIVKEICELNSYDDRNFLIHVDKNIKNPLIAHDCPHGYVLKIINTLDSNKLSFMDAQIKMMQFLAKKDIKCSKPISNVFGQYYSIETLGPNNHKHAVRLLEYIPGKIFKDVTTTDNLIYQLGEFVALFDNALKSFEHEAYDTHKSLWMLQNVSQLKYFWFVIRDVERLGIVENVIELFEKKVLSKLDEFEEGIIHGDFNESNILVRSGIEPKPEEYRVFGILDFGDTARSRYLFEIGIAMVYVMIQTESLESGGLFIAGYEEVRTIPKQEKEVLKICILARLVQSLVMGAYTYSLDPKNEYLLLTQKAGWKILEELYQKTDEEIIDLWSAKADHYLKQSTK